ncbi:hypothetical protein BDV25DRAFT_122114 [Aspergillus avenaceus]|uniref:Non-specific serine/threonine protein kinase n=1 Tax=Aspergillus avenaceus TaxID=36643 RepID=A0A5N6TU18_ASPAV|nr:hypothetical protein BDV25DRAFT_122114 [Aspergillus avenaceus]
MSRDCIVSPYSVGSRHRICSHHPPPPVALNQPGRNLLNLDYDDPQVISQTCVRNPPVAGVDGTDRIVVQITESINVGLCKRAQVVTARVLDAGSLTSFTTDQVPIAKFYDPYYESFNDQPFLGVDINYTHECAAYTRLADLQGSFIPVFFGSFTLRLPVGDQCRIVRLILVEKISGSSMDRLDISRYSRFLRQRYLKEIIDAESALYTKDICHRDLCPCNVMFTIPRQRNRPVVIIDFGFVDFGRSRKPSDPEIENAWFPGVPISPLLRWQERYSRRTSFTSWIDWEWQPWLEAQCEHTRDSITDAQRERWQPLPQKDHISPPSSCSF